MFSGHVPRPWLFDSCGNGWVDSTLAIRRSINRSIRSLLMSFYFWCGAETNPLACTFAAIWLLILHSGEQHNSSFVAGIRWRRPGAVEDEEEDDDDDETTTTCDHEETA